MDTQFSLGQDRSGTDSTSAHVARNSHDLSSKQKAPVETAKENDVPLYDSRRVKPPEWSPGSHRRSRFSLGAEGRTTPCSNGRGNGDIESHDSEFRVKTQNKSRDMTRSGRSRPLVVKVPSLPRVSLDCNERQEATTSLNATSSKAKRDSMVPSNRDPPLRPTPTSVARDLFGDPKTGPRTLKELRTTLNKQTFTHTTLYHKHSTSPANLHQARLFSQTGSFSSVRENSFDNAPIQNASAPKTSGSRTFHDTRRTPLLSRDVGVMQQQTDLTTSSDSDLEWSSNEGSQEGMPILDWLIAQAVDTAVENKVVSTSVNKVNAGRGRDRKLFGSEKTLASSPRLKLARSGSGARNQAYSPQVIEVDGTLKQVKDTSKFERKFTTHHPLQPLSECSEDRVSTVPFVSNGKNANRERDSHYGRLTVSISDPKVAERLASPSPESARGMQRHRVTSKSADADRQKQTTGFGSASVVPKDLPAAPRRQASRQCRKGECWCSYCSIEKTLCHKLQQHSSLVRSGISML